MSEKQKNSNQYNGLAQDSRNPPPPANYTKPSPTPSPPPTSKNK